MYVAPLEEVLCFKVVPSQEELLTDGRLQEFDAARGKAIFVSHQWASDKHPDPEGQQLKVFQGAMRNLLSGSTVAYPNAYDEIFWLSTGLQLPSFDRLKLSETPLVVWYDYFSIPQKHSKQINVETSESANLNAFKNHQREAILSIPAYIDCCEFFVVLAPPVKHATTQSTLDIFSWGRRGWCQAEAMIRRLSVKSGLVLVLESPVQVSFASTVRSSFLALGDGEFAVPGDREVVARVLKLSIRKKLRDLLYKKDFHNYRFLLNHQHMQLRHCETQPVAGLVDLESAGVQAETILDGFLRKNAFRHVSEVDTAGWPPLCYAALGGQPDLVKVLLEKRADPNDSIDKSKPAARLERGASALFIASAFGNTEAMQGLISGRADPNKTDSIGATPLMAVSECDNVYGARLLLEAGANQEHTNIFGIDAFCVACVAGATRVARELSSPHALSSAARACVLHSAVIFGASPDHVSALLEMGLDINSQWRPANTTVWLAAKALELKHLVAHSTLSLIAYHQRGNTPLMNAILGGNFASARLLLEAGARLDLRNCRGRTAYDLAVLHGATENIFEFRGTEKSHGPDVGVA